MALLTPKMSLRLWEQLQDPYSHDQLADNFSKIDFHDHTPGRGNQVPTEGLFDGSVTGVKLDASTLAPWRTIAFGTGFLIAATVAGVYALTTNGSGIVSGGSWSTAQPFFHVDPADYAITGRTTQFRIKGSAYVNATAPAANFTFGLYPIGTLAGGAGVVTSTLATVQAGSTATVTAPVASSANLANSGGFTITAGHFYVGVALSATIAASSQNAIRVDLQVHHV
jgi:hypothetical protein